MPIVLVVVIRSIIAFIVLLFLVRLLGKQQVSQLTFFDYVVGITIGSIASTPFSASKRKHNRNIGRDGNLDSISIFSGCFRNTQCLGAQSFIW
jgi:hypothetical protein